MEVSDDRKTLGMALGCAVKVIASTCVATGQAGLAGNILMLWKARRFDELAGVFEVMAASWPKPDDVRPS
ncbi:MAG: hypothetical protein OXC14_00015 [Rhodospirillaceae bacterium]|nr:hypothetical protein [Rhodospirillaceae bacterium]